LPVYDIERSSAIGDVPGAGNRSLAKSLARLTISVPAACFSPDVVENKSGTRVGDRFGPALF
jgi:hypothetical protein